MCNPAAQANWSIGVPTTEDRLTGLLTPNVPIVPKVSLPLPLTTALKARQAAFNAVTKVPTEENETMHITADSAYLTANSAVTGASGGRGAPTPALVSVVGPIHSALIEVKPPQQPKSVGIGIGDILSLALSVIGSIVLTDLTDLTNEPPLPPPPPLLTYEVAVTGSSATLVGCKQDPSQLGAAGPVGLNVLCIARAGGASVLSTITSCLPALAQGWDAFTQALLSALGPGGVDLVERLSECF
jgi:hypothetical protein